MIRTLLLASLSIAPIAIYADEEAKLPVAPLNLQSVYEKISSEPGGVNFIPPASWKFVDPSHLPQHVKMMFIGQGSSEFPPSINLGYDQFSGGLKPFIKLAKQINQTQGFETKDLGTVKTEAGNAVLLQVDSKTKWGVERQLQAILSHDGKIWILTCSSLKEEFARSYTPFFDAIRSIKINSLSSNNIQNTTLPPQVKL